MTSYSCANLPAIVDSSLSAAAVGVHGPGAEYPLWLGIPFVGILLSIALFPVFAPKFWHKKFPWVSLFWAVATLVPFALLFPSNAFRSTLHIFIVDYIPFIILLWGLFTVSSGIALKGTLSGTPFFNTCFLFAGAVLASFMGTTGAAMLTIRPLLRANKKRKSKAHTIIFFIFLVANIGGALTPLGDPPLFLGFLHSVPFFWTLRLFPIYAFAVVVLLAVYFLMDSMLYRKEGPEGRGEKEAAEKIRFSIQGAHNFLCLFGILGAVLLSGFWNGPVFSVGGFDFAAQTVARDLLILAFGIVSFRTTSQDIRVFNEFSWEPIREVAILFAGIFAAIVPVIEILKAGETGQLGFIVRAVQSPAEYFWAVGGLSSFLDNAPTYYTFFNMSLGRFYAGMAEAVAVKNLIALNPVYLQAISAGAVFMGANTYIGNAPNFMVRSIAEEAGIRMPTFFGYMFCWSVPILIPIFALITWIFF